jgi:hypothetical protein
VISVDVALVSFECKTPSARCGAFGGTDLYWDSVASL